MKKALFGGFSVLGIAVVAGAAVVLLRPDLAPSWARPVALDSDIGPFCEEHGVPEKFCTACHPELASGLLLCPEHGGLPENICTLCHPDVKQKYGIATCEHGLPEHFCQQCQALAGETQGSANLINDGWCKEFGAEGPDGTLKCQLLPLVRLASAGLAEVVGLKTVDVTEVEDVPELLANAETDFDANRYAGITPRVSGFLREARFDLGQRVEPGTVVAVVDSAEVSSAKTQYITELSAFDLAKDTHARLRALQASNHIAPMEVLASRSDLNQAQAKFLDAEQRLRNFGFDDEGLARIAQENDTRPLLEVTTPLGGDIVFRHAVQGEAVGPMTKLYQVADMSTVWLWIGVYESDMSKVEEGQAVRFTVMGGESEVSPAVYEGKVTWVGVEVDQTTRTTKVRAELPNPDGKLRAHQFGKARIALGVPHKALTITKGAVQRYEGVDLVFLTESPGVYRPQRIKAEPFGRGDLLEVSWGLEPGQSVVTDGSFLLKTEIMKGSIGAGCCD